MGQFKDKIFIAGMFLQQYMGAMVIIIVALLYFDPYSDDETKLMLILLFINAVIALIASILTKNRKWQFQPVALIVAAVFMLMSYNTEGGEFWFMIHLNFLAGALFSLYGADKDSFGSSFSSSSSNYWSNPEPKEKSKPGWLKRDKDDFDYGTNEYGGGFR
jgi:chromate transport protein ChrA